MVEPAVPPTSYPLEIAPPETMPPVVVTLVDR